GLASLHRLPHSHLDRRQVAIAGRQAVAVIDIDHPPIATAPSGGGHGAIRLGPHRLANLAVNVDARMHRRRTLKRRLPISETRSEIDIAFYRFADRHVVERAREPTNLNAGEADAINLALECGSLFRRVWSDKWPANPRQVVRIIRPAEPNSKFAQY